MTVKLMSCEVKKRDRLLNAALKEFVMQGYERASTNSIAKEAGISKPLLFHYVESKQELYFFVYQYFSELLEQEYYTKLNLENRDIFDRLRKSYELQIRLLMQYPCIFGLQKLSDMEKLRELNIDLEDRFGSQHTPCQLLLFENMDCSRFRKELDIEMCKNFILWSNIGFTNKILEDLSNFRNESDRIFLELENYLSELKKIFYSQDKE